MLRWLIRSAQLRVVLVVVSLFLAWQVFIFLRPHPRSYTVDEIGALRAAAGRTANALAMKAPGPARIGVAHLTGDPGGTATAILKERLARQPGWKVEEQSIIQRFLADVSRAVADATSFEEVLRAGQKVELDVVMGGRVLAVEATNGAARAAVQILAYDTRKGGLVLREIIDAEWRPTLLDRAGRGLARVGPGWRFAIWLTVVLALPWVTRFATARVLERKSNLAAFALIGAYTVTGLALAAAMTGFQLIGGGQWLRFFAALVFCAGYSFWACERIAGRENA